MTKELELKNRIRIEEQRRTARIIKRVNGKLRAGSVTSVVAPDKNGVWREVTEKDDIEIALLERMNGDSHRQPIHRFSRNPYYN